MKPESLIYTPKGDNEHPRPFIMGVPPLGAGCDTVPFCEVPPPTRVMLEISFTISAISRQLSYKTSIRRRLACEK